MKICLDLINKILPQFIANIDGAQIYIFWVTVYRKKF